MTKLNTRPPTCAVPWPLILVEGGEKSGKSWMFAELSASPKVGRSLWLDIGEGSADEYGDAITGKPTYEVVVHDGSWASIYGQVQAAHAEAKRARAAGEKPVCLGIDSMTLLWEMLKDWAGDRAARTDSNRARLARDPGAEIKIPTHIWTDVHARWSRLMRLLMTFEGIAVVTARGKDTIKIGGDGKPVEGERDYKVEAQRNLQFDATVWVRLSRDAHPMIVGARSKHLRIRYGRDEARVDVDVLAGEHRLDALAQPGAFGERHQQADRLVGGAVLGVVEVKVPRGHPHAGRTPGILREQLPQMPSGQRGVVLGQLPPLGRLGDISHRSHSSPRRCRAGRRHAPGRRAHPTWRS